MNEEDALLTLEKQCTCKQKQDYCNACKNYDDILYAETKPKEKATLRLTKLIQKEDKNGQ